MVRVRNDVILHMIKVFVYMYAIPVQRFLLIKIKAITFTQIFVS